MPGLAEKWVSPRKQVRPDDIEIGKIRSNNTKRLFQNTRCDSKSFATLKDKLREESLISTQESLALRPFGCAPRTKWRQEPIWDGTGRASFFCSGPKAVVAGGDSFEIVSKKGFTNSRAMAKYSLNRGENIKSEMGRAIK